MKAFPRLALLLPLFTACVGEETSGTQDVRVDHAARSQDPESEAPRSCVTSQGKVYVVWQDARAGASGIWFNASNDAGVSWMTADVQLNASEAAATNPDIACAGDRVFVAWEDERDGELQNHNVYFNVSEDAGRHWREEDVRLDGDEDGDAMSLGPRVAAAGNSVYVAWFDSREGAYDIYVQSSDDNGATFLDAAVRVDTDEEGEAYSAWPQIAADSDGNVVVAWEDSRSGNSDIYANASSDGGVSFGASDQRLDGGEEAGLSNSFLPSLALSSGRAYAVWQDERYGTGRDVLINVSEDAGGSWAAQAARVDSDAEGLSDSLNPRIAAVNQAVHVAWQDDRSGGYDIYTRSSLDGATSWTAEEVRMDTDAGGESQSYNPVIAALGASVLVGWEDRRADQAAVGFNDLYYNFSADAGATWNGEDLRINSNEPGSAYAVDLALATDGDTLIAVWADGRFGTSDIFCAKRAVGEASVYVEPEEE